MNGFDTVFLFKKENDEWSFGPLDWHNRGFLFGDGLFETMVFQNKKIRFSDDHELRLMEGVDILGLERTGISSIHHIEKILNLFFPKSEPLRIRWNIFRRGLGKYSPTENLTHETLQIESFIKPVGLKINAFVSEKIRVPELPWSHCKTMNALTYVMANQDRVNRKMDEVILLNSKGLVSEAGSSNIFWVRNGVYFTPSLSCSCISGIGRKQIIKKLNQLGIEIIEGEFLPVELIKADKVFTSNVTGISHIHKIGEWEFETNPDNAIEQIFH
ncbi:aminodeoxychorismate lyase [Cyclobacteriaceae bacterium YHN15]|nr:aminodeoxychorismate lyase [Cyclobacteriaceae bacterium YHN15]